MSQADTAYVCFQLSDFLNSTVIECNYLFYKVDILYTHNIFIEYKLCAIHLRLFVAEVRITLAYINKRELLIFQMSSPNDLS